MGLGEIAQIPEKILVLNGEGTSGSGHQPGILWGWLSMQEVKK